MKYPKTFSIVMVLLVTALIVGFTVINTKAQSAEVVKEKQESAATMSFPEGTATPSELCGGCHRAIYREFALGFGSDTKYKKMVLVSAKEPPFTMPANVSSSVSAHASPGIQASAGRSFHNAPDQQNLLLYAGIQIRLMK